MRNEQIDAWMFLAVASGRTDRQRAALIDVIGAADWINHLIVLDEELRGGLNRLMAGELVDEVEGGFGLTVAGEALLAKVSNGAGLWKQWDRLEADLMNLEHPSEPMWVPREGEIDQAIQAYHRQARGQIGSLARSHQRRGF